MATQYPPSSTKAVAVVTGASSGIGRELAIEAAGRGLGRGFLDQDFSDITHVI